MPLLIAQPVEVRSASQPFRWSWPIRDIAPGDPSRTVRTRV
jgi:hypothetical protein